MASQINMPIAMRTKINLPTLLRLLANAVEYSDGEVATKLEALPEGRWRDFGFTYLIRDGGEDHPQEAWIDVMTDTEAQVPRPVVESEGQDTGQETS